MAAFQNVLTQSGRIGTHTRVICVKIQAHNYNAMLPFQDQNYANERKINMYSESIEKSHKGVRQMFAKKSLP